MTEEPGEREAKKLLLPHHKQQPLCMSRKPYRQGRKLTAVKAYTITTESNHLLIFGVPSLNLRQETKALFQRYGKMKHFAISPNHLNESFTDTYHVAYENVMSARVAKRMLDTKNFYGGVLHICYAPELENVFETRKKLHRRQQEVNNRLTTLQASENIDNNKTRNRGDGNDNGEKSTEHTDKTKDKLNMGEINTIYLGSLKNVALDKRKRKHEPNNRVIEKPFKPCFIENEVESALEEAGPSKKVISYKNSNVAGCEPEPKKSKLTSQTDDIEIVDFTSTEKETLSNINEALNYRSFGSELIRKVTRPLNRIVFHIYDKKDTKS